MNLILMAVAPVMVIILYIYFQDKYEKEPIGLLLASFLFGAIVSDTSQEIFFYAKILSKIFRLRRAPRFDLSLIIR